MAIPLKKICRDNLNTYVTKLSESKAGLTSKGDYTLDSDVCIHNCIRLFLYKKFQRNCLVHACNGPINIYSVIIGFYR